MAECRPRSGSPRPGDDLFSAPRPKDSSVPSWSKLNPRRLHLPPRLRTPLRSTDGSEKIPSAQVADLRFLQNASRRAGRLREEGRCYYSLGVLYDNAGRWRDAIKCYTQFLRICERCRDAQGEALAYHCLGVDYHFLGKAESDRGSTDSAEEFLMKALGFYQKHLDLVGSVEGRYLTNVNMSRVYAALGDEEECLGRQKLAKGYAQQLQPSRSSAGPADAVLINMDPSEWARSPSEKLMK
ncbi:hypothetical protein FOL46_007199 [Perkinsus olseni]|uniref:Uncharacterized protein n=1 Tax=Perkinsus olseni TaxID=32597 RepID=A0A7J6MXT8_PEROL|nr:hypothetical protein FOL46_007199 [Perkinsus olseni]